VSLLDSILFPTLSALAAGRGSAKSEPYLQALQTTRPIELDCRRRSGCSVVGNIQNLEESSLGTVARRTPCSRLRTHSRATDYLARQLSVAWQGTPRAKAQGQIGRQDIPQASPTSPPEVPLLIHQRKLSSPRCSPLLSDDSDTCTNSRANAQGPIPATHSQRAIPRSSVVVLERALVSSRCCTAGMR
jgi:hypothetical protein